MRYKGNAGEPWCKAIPTLSGDRTNSLRPTTTPTDMIYILLSLPLFRICSLEASHITFRHLFAWLLKGPVLRKIHFSDVFVKMNPSKWWGLTRTGYHGKNNVETVKALSMEKKKKSSANVVIMVCNHSGSFIKYAPKLQKDLWPHVCH